LPLLHFKSTKMNRYFIVLMVFLNPYLVCSQEGELIKSFEDSLKNVQTISYSATMLTKLFSSEGFTERHFDVYAKRNWSNEGYNSDWEIVEYDEESERRYLFMGSDFYYIDKKYKVIGYRNNIGKLSTGDYFESMRWYTLFDEVLYDFYSLYGNDRIKILPKDQNEKFIQIKISINDEQDRCLFLNKSNLFPERVVNTVSNMELDLKQIIETKLSNIQFNPTHPDTVLSPQYYLNQEYKVKHQENDKKEGTTKSEHFNADRLDFLLQTRLVSETGDSTSLDEIDADLLLVDFWYMSCMPCLKSLPHLQELSDKYKSRGFKVIGINCHDTANKEYAIGKLKEKGILYPNFFGSRSFLKQLNVKAFPTYILLDKNQNIVYMGVGIGKDMESIIEEELE